MKLAMLFILIFPAVILLPAAIAVVTKPGLAGIHESRPARLLADPVRLLGSLGQQRLGVRRLNANTFFYNTTLAFVMLFGRFLMKIPVLALAGSLAGKRAAPPSAGTFPTNGAIFVVLLIG